MDLISWSPQQQQCLPGDAFAVSRGLLRSTAALEGKTSLQRLNFHKDLGYEKRYVWMPSSGRKPCHWSG